MAQWGMVRALGISLWLLAASCAGLNRGEPVDVAPEMKAAPAAVGEVSGKLRVVTYNVHGEGAAVLARALAGSERLEDADVVFLQEIEDYAAEDASTAAQLAARLGMAYAYAPGYGLDGGGSHGVAVLSRYPLSDVEVIELPRYSVHFNSARRVALGVTLAVGDERVRLYSVHLDNRVNPSRRVRQLAPVIEAATEQPIERVIIAGDMNTSPFCWLTHVVPIPCGLQTRRLDRYVRRAGFDTPVADAPATSQWLSMRLDAIYTRGLAAVGYGVERRVRVSDHLPVWLDVALHEATR